jgi:hypothetical protein
VTEYYGRGLNSEGMQRETCTEGDVVDQHAVWLNCLDDHRQFIEYSIGLVEQVVAAGISLVAQGCQWTRPCGVEERLEVLILSLGLIANFNDAAVTASAEPKLNPRKSRCLDGRPGCAAGGDDDLTAGTAPFAANLQEGQRMGQVVRADD